MLLPLLSVCVSPRCQFDFYTPQVHSPPDTAFPVFLFLMPGCVRARGAAYARRGPVSCDGAAPRGSRRRARGPHQEASASHFCSQTEHYKIFLVVTFFTFIAIIHVFRLLSRSFRGIVLLGVKHSREALYCGDMDVCKSRNQQDTKK